jgi:DNA polymerase-3 subunit delta'
LTLLAGDGLAIAQGTRKLAEAGSQMDLKALHALSDLVAARGQTDNWESFPARG